MIEYSTWCAIRDGVAKHLTPAQLAMSLSLDIKTVRHWIGRPYEPRATVVRPSKLDPFKGRIVGWLDAHPLSAQQVFQRLQEAGYRGGISIVKEYVHKIRPPMREDFLTLAFAPGEVAQVDWGEYGTIAVGNTRRRLSFFVMVLAWSRLMYVEFTCSQTMEQFLAAHINAFNALGVPKKIMVDNLRSAVLKHPRGEPAQFNPRYLDFARHYGFEIVACAPAKGNEKGRVERGVGYVKANFLHGMDLPGFAAINPAVQVWLESVANVRLHRDTHRRPVDLWAEERVHLQAVNPRLYDVGRVLTLRADRQFRVTFEGNRYSVPARFAGNQAGLLERRGNAMAHVRKIVALAQIHGDEAVTRAMADALAFEAFSSEYIAHLIDARTRQLPEASPLLLMHHQDVLELELPPADMSAYAGLATPKGESHGSV